MKWWQKLEQGVREFFSSTPPAPPTQSSLQPHEGGGQRPLRDLMRAPEGYSFNVPPAVLNAAMHQQPQQPQAAAPIIPRLDQLDYSAGNVQAKQKIDPARHLRRPAKTLPIETPPSATTPPSAASRYMGGSTLISPAMSGGDRRKGPEVTIGPADEKQFTNKGTVVMPAVTPPGQKP